LLFYVFRLNIELVKRRPSGKGANKSDANLALFLYADEYFFEQLLIV